MTFKLRFDGDKVAVVFCGQGGLDIEDWIDEQQQVRCRDLCGRFQRDACGEIHYQNPKLVVGAVPEWNGRLLLCRRAIEPRYGYWTLPAGFMENGETTQEAARRESIEEAMADVEIGSLLAVVHVLHADQVHVMFRARLAAVSRVSTSRLA